MFAFPVVIFLLICHQSVTVLSSQGVQVTSFNCDPNGQADFTQNFTFPDGFTSVDFNLLPSNVVKDMACNWTFPSGIEGYFLLNRLVLAPQEVFTLLGFSENGTESELFKGTSIPNAGFIDAKNTKSLKLSLQLKGGQFSRSFSAQYSTKWPTILTPEEGTLTLVLNQANSSINSKLTLSPPYADQTKFLLTFLRLPLTYNIAINGQAYSDKNKLPTHLMIDTPNVTIDVTDYNPFANPINVRFWAVTKACSGEIELKNDGTEIHIPYVNDTIRNMEKLTDAKCVNLLKGVPGSQILVNIPENSTSMLYPEDSLTFYDSEGKLEFSLNEPAMIYFRNVDTFLLKDEYLVVYKSPYFSENSSQNFIMPTLKAVPNSGCFMVQADKPVEKTIGDGKLDLNDVHTIYNMDHFNPGGKVAGIMLDFIGNAQVTPGDWSISVYNNEMKNSVPLLVLGKFDLIPASIPVTTGVMRVVFKGKVPNLKLKYSAIEESKNCIFLSDSMNSFNVNGDQPSRDGICSWIVPVGTGNFTILSPIYVKVPINKTLTLTMFAEKGSSVQKFEGPLDRTFMPDMFLPSESLYQISINTSGSTSNDLHVMFERRSDYIVHQIVAIDSKTDNVKSVNYPGAYPVGYNQTYNIPGQGQALMTVQDMSLLKNHNFSVFSSAEPNQVFVSNNLSEVYDKIITFPVFLTFLTEVDFPNMAKDMAERARGFDVDFMHASVATNIDVAKTSTWEYGKAGNASFSDPIAVWVVRFDDSSQTSISDTILKINATFEEDPSVTKATLKVYDSKSIRKDYAHDALLHVNSTGKEKQFATTTRIAFIVYNFTDAIPTKKDFGVKFTVAHEKCSHSGNYTLNKCKTQDRCITDWMICNGVNECGDWSDEMYCGGQAPPTPPGPTPAPSGGGVSVIVAIFLLMPLGAILGIFGYVYLPHALLRLRNGRYSEFRDLSSVS